MRAYTVAAAAVSLGITPKTLDNILTRYDIEGISRARQGVSRRLTTHALMTLNVALRLSRSAFIPLNTAITMAKTVLGQSQSTLEVGKGISIEFDLALIRKDLDARLAEAVEVAPAPRRGRPPRR